MLSSLILVGVALSFYAAAGVAAQDEVAINPALPSLFIAGDSTAAKTSTVHQQGWAEPFTDYFEPSKINVVNLARGGRSSRTFISEGHWQKLVEQVKRGDTVLIQFGHNDAGALNREPPASTLPLRARGSIKGIGDSSEEIDNVVTGQHEVVHSFGWYLRRMIGDVRARGATPVLMSLTIRNIWNDGWIECGAGRYREWDVHVARAAGVQFIDLSQIVADKYQRLGMTAVDSFFKNDQVHTNASGADFNAANVVSGLRSLNGAPFNKLLSAKGRAVSADKGPASDSVCEKIPDQ